MNEHAWLLDWALALTLVGLAWHVLFSRDLFRAIVFFIAFGLLLTLIWVRLDAVDIALAEAAIGAGLTGVLFLTTLSHLESITDSDDETGKVFPQEHPDDETR